MIDISHVLAQARRTAGLSQEQLAQAIGITRAQVSRIESGSRGTTYEVIARWLDVCGYDIVAVRRASPAVTALAAEIEAAESRYRALLLRVIRLLPRLDDRAYMLLVRHIEALEEDAASTQASLTSR